MLDAGIHVAMAALELCTARIDAIAKVPSLRKDRVGVAVASVIELACIADASRLVGEGLRSSRDIRVHLT